MKSNAPQRAWNLKRSGSFRQPDHARPASSVMPCQSTSIHPSPPESQPAQQQGSRGDRITHAQCAPRRRAAIGRGHPQSPRTHAQGLAAATPAEHHIHAGHDPAAQPQQPPQQRVRRNVLVRIVAAEEGIAEREGHRDKYPQRQHRPQVVGQGEQAPADQRVGFCADGVFLVGLHRISIAGGRRRR